MIQSGALHIERRLLRFGFCRVEHIFYGVKLRLRFVECGKARRELHFILV